MTRSSEATVTRREAVTGALKVAIGTTLVSTFAAEPSSAALADEQKQEYVPENDYPFFGGELPAAYRENS